MIPIPPTYQSVSAIQWGAVMGISLVAAVCDLRFRRIPNLLTGPALLAGMLWCSCVGGFSGLLDSLGGMCLSVAPGNSRYLANKAMAQGLAGGFDDALETYKKVLPEGKAHYNVGILCEVRNDQLRADEEYRKAAKLGVKKSDE